MHPVTHKRCTSCRTEKPEECFRLRRIKAAKQGLGSRVATCTECEAAINPDGNRAKPPPLWTQPQRYEADGEDSDVQRFRRELEQRGIARGA